MGRRPTIALFVAALAVTAAWLLLALVGDVAQRLALREALGSARPPPAVTAFYAARNYRPVWVESRGPWPLWTRPTIRLAARERAQLVVAAARTQASTASRLTAASGLRRNDLGTRAQAAQVEVALTTTLVGHAEALSRARARELAFVDPAFPGPAATYEYLQWATFAPSAVGDLGQVNPVYDALAEGLARYRRGWSRLPQMQVPAGPQLGVGDRGGRVATLRARLGLPRSEIFDAEASDAVSRFQKAHGLAVTGTLDGATLTALNRGAAHYERLIARNLERAQALPPPLGDRFILVNPAAAQLWMYEGNQVVDTMKVVVGSRREPTPAMVGLIRSMAYNPYWEIPVDIAKEGIAPKAVRSGPGYVEGRRIQVLSDWSDEAHVVRASQVNWSKVASGEAEVRLRQVPGPANMMGTVKFLMPNELGIYLHDTPDKTPFRSDRRQLSAGCVRLEHADALAGWILRDRPLNPAFLGPDHIVHEFSPVTVYVVYLTASPAADGGVTFHPDVYDRDAASRVGAPQRDLLLISPPPRGREPRA